MDENFKRALKLTREDIINDFDPTYLWVGVLNDKSQTEKIKKGVSSYSSPSDFEEKRRHWVKHLLDILPTKNNHAFKIFVKNIRDYCRQEHLARALEEYAENPPPEMKTPIKNSCSVYANVNIEDFVGLNRSTNVPKRLFSNRIKICELQKTSKEQIGVIQFQYIHKMVKRETTIGVLYSFYIADESGGINLLAKENDGKALDTMLKIKSFYELSSWGLKGRNKDIKINSLSNHDFELWIDQLPSLTQIPMIADNAQIMPFRDIQLKTVDKILFLPEGSVDVIGMVHKVYGKENKKKLIELKNSKSRKNDKIITVKCHLFNDNVDLITKQDTIVVIKGADIKVKKSELNCLWAGTGSYIFLVNDSFEDSWIPEDQHPLVKSLKPKPKPRSSSDLTDEVERALNGVPEPVQSTSSNCGAVAQSRSVTTPSSSTPKVNAEKSTPRRGMKRKYSLADVDKKTKRGSKLESLCVSDLKIVEAKVVTYLGCPNDNCTKKNEDVTCPYKCDGIRCQNSPMKRERKKRYTIKCTVCNEDAPEVTKVIKAFDSVARQLFQLTGIDPSSTDNEIVDKLMSHTYNIDIIGTRKDGTWDLTIQNVNLSD